MSPTSAPTAPRPASDRTSPALAVTGFLMLLALFLNANPYFGRERMWPWDLFGLSLGSKFVEAEIIFWAFSGAWALAMAFTGAIRLRSTVAAGLALTILLESARPDSGVRIERFYLNDMLPLVGMGTGLLLALRPASQRLGRMLCAASAITFVWAFLVGFTGAEVTPRYVLFLNDLGATFTGGDYSSARYAYAWYYLAPQLVLFVAAAMCLLATFGVTGRKFLIASFVLLVVGMATPIPVRVVGALTGGDPDVSQVGGALFVGLIADGVLVWLFATVALADVGYGREEAA